MRSRKGGYRAEQGHTQAGCGYFTVRVRCELLFDWREEEKDNSAV